MIQLFDRGLDDFDFFAAELAAFAGVRIQARNRDARRGRPRR